MKKVRDFSKIKALVVGDVMIDRYWWGSVERISPEAPVPVVRLENTILVAGGAANVAANIAGLGAEPFLIGAVGADKDGVEFENLLKSNGINPSFITKLDNHTTTVKTRVIAHNQQVARIDQELPLRLNENKEEKIWREIEILIDKTDVTIISDYAKGFLTDKLLTSLITKCNNEKKIVLVDPKGKNFFKYKNADILTPNKKEVSEADTVKNNSFQTIEKTAQTLLSDLNLRALLVTRGEEGMMLCEKNKEVLYLTALARDVYDVTGAGDTVIATLALAISSGSDLIESANLANMAAGLVVEQVGTTAIKIDQLNEAVERYDRLQQ